MAIDTKDIYKIAAHHRFQWEKAQDCYVILFPEGMVKLNGSAGEVLNLVNGESTVESITEILSKKFTESFTSFSVRNSFLLWRVLIIS